MEKSWYVYAKKADFGDISRRYGIDPVTARVLRNRDIIEDEDIRLFLEGSLEDLKDPMGLPDMKKAVELLYDAIREGRHIRIVGDYDIDGVCATYIMYRTLSVCGARVDQVIPERIRDGYGINMRLIDEAESEGVDVIVTVDNGIAAMEELARAKSLGMTVIITDHHDLRTDQEGGELIPPSDAAVDPKRDSCSYEGTRDICGAMVAFRLSELLLSRAGLGKEIWLELLPFAAIATVGDVMPLTGENRIVVREGLRAINEERDRLNPGLQELIKACGIDDRLINSYHIGFILGPCINAGGRLETALSALKLFLCDDRTEAAALAGHLRLLNDERKSMTEKGVEEAIKTVEVHYAHDLVLVVELPWLHESLAGIVAGRLREHFGKPSFVLTDTDTEGVSKGSGRSIEAYHMFQGLQKQQELLLRYGGHPMAAGLSLRTGDIGELRLRLNRDCSLREQDLIEKIWIDAPMPISYVSERLIEDHEALAPFGNGNPRPLFAEKGLIAYDMKVLGKNKNVLRLSLREEGRAPLQAVMFGDAQRLYEEIKGKERIDVLYSPQINEYNGRREIQLSIHDIR